MQSQLPPPRARGPSPDSNPITLFPKPPKASALTNVAVQSFAAFRAQTSSVRAPSPVRRKPLPVDASPIASRFSSAEYTRSPRLVGEGGFTQRSFSIDSPPLKAPPRPETILSPPLSSTQEDFAPRDLDRHPHGHTPLTATPPTAIPSFPQPPRQTRTLEINTAQRPRHDRAISSYHTARGSISEEGEERQAHHLRSPTMPNMPLYSTQTPSEAAETQPNLTLQLDGVTSDFLDDDPYSPGPESAQHSKPKSPGGTFGTFFGWRKSSQQNGADSPTTTFSDRSLSPAHSPALSRQIEGHNTKQGTPSALDIPTANSTYNPASYFNVPGTPLFSSSPTMNAHVEELERELREVSSELAESIRREMELEDEVERWKMESSTMGSDVNRRTSDYYSDSGASSVRYPVGDSEGKLEEVERLRRKAEQDRAQLKVSMSERLSDELRRRRDLEEQVQNLEEKVHSKESRGESIDGSGRTRELESSLEDARRRLAEERQVKENFEDLLTALRQELEKHRNERDNLRDEIVPQLKARVEGLEAESSEVQTLIYESTRMQQEIQALKNENQTLVNARRMQLELAQQQQQQQSRFKSIAEEAEPPVAAATPKIGLSRSNSLARSSAFNSKRGSLSRSNSVKDKPTDVKRDSFQNPLKEIEEQRDALHRALKALLHRQEYQTKEYEKRIKQLEVERDNALSITPRRTTFHKEVKHLRDEVNHLRRRADDALEQKWQCEKGLGGLRMDLDRAQQETSSLRDLLTEHDIFVPERRKGSVTSIRSEDAIPDSLDKAYNELQTTHALSLARIKEMESEDSLGRAGEEAETTMALLKQSISDAEAERDIAHKEAKEYRLKARALQQSEIEHLGKEQSLSAELYAAAIRMDELSAKVHQQLRSNQALRKRLADAILRGEKEQEKSTSTIVELERKLKSAEEKVMSAQQSSEESIAKHEEEVKRLKESQGEQLRRVKAGLLSPARFSPTIPVSPMFALKSPKLDKTSSGLGMTMAEATKTELLETRVQGLEKALSEADREMEEVVGRMNLAQIEVAELQFERDEAMQSTRKLQAAILAEREKVKALMS